MLRRWVSNLLLITVAGLLAVAAPASAHEGHSSGTNTTVDAKSTSATALMAVPVAGVRSHCPSNDGGCCWHSDGYLGSYQPRVIAGGLGQLPLPSSPAIGRDAGTLARDDDPPGNTVLFSPKRARAPPPLHH